jgi:hypothetical protein
MKILSTECPSSETLNHDFALWEIACASKKQKVKTESRFDNKISEKWTQSLYWNSTAESSETLYQCTVHQKIWLD